MMSITQDGTLGLSDASATDALSVQEAAVGLVKWYDGGRGFGFILIGSPARDAFIHVTALQRSGEDEPAQGDRITCELSYGPKGLQVEKILSMDRIGGTEKGSRSSHEVIHLTGRVKFYDAEKGYGFVRDDNGLEVFIGSKMLRRLNLVALRPEQLVKVSAVRSERGLVAETLTFLGVPLDSLTVPCAS